MAQTLPLQSDKAFLLRCCNDESPVAVVMFRNRCWDVADDFTVRAVDDGRWLGWGATKDEAAFDAELTLGDEHRARMLAIVR